MNITGYRYDSPSDSQSEEENKQGSRGLVARAVAADARQREGARGEADCRHVLTCQDRDSVASGTTCDRQSGRERQPQARRSSVSQSPRRSRSRSSSRSYSSNRSRSSRSPRRGKRRRRRSSRYSSSWSRSRSRSPRKRARSRSPPRRSSCRSPSPRHGYSGSRRSPARRHSSPYRRRSRSPYRRRSRSPYRRRSRSPYRRRSPSPYRRRDSSPYRKRSRSPYHRRNSPERSWRKEYGSRGRGSRRGKFKKHRGFGRNTFISSDEDDYPRRRSPPRRRRESEEPKGTTEKALATATSTVTADAPVATPTPTPAPVVTAANAQLMSAVSQAAVAAQALASQVASASAVTPAADYLVQLRAQHAAAQKAALGTQLQKRKMIWANKKTVTTTTPASVSVYQSVPFDDGVTNEQQAKFRRLMGMGGGLSTADDKGDAKAEAGTTSNTEGLREQYEKVQKDLDQQYAMSRVFTHTARGMGLGFGST